MAAPKRKGTRIGETDGFYSWNGFTWTDNRVSSFNNGSGGLPYTGNLPNFDFGDFKFDIDLSDFKFDLPKIDIPPLHFPLKISLKSNPSDKKGFLFTDTGVSVPNRNGVFEANSKDFLFLHVLLYY